MVRHGQETAVLAKKSRRGRPPGRRAPHRPVLSTVLSGRVDPEFLRQVKAAAKAAGRSVSEQVLWLAERGLVLTTAHEDAGASIRKAYDVANAVLAAAQRMTDLEELAERAATRAIEKMKEG